MTPFRIALANVRFPASPNESVEIAKRAVERAGREGAKIVCFPECYVPGYRAPGKNVLPVDEAFLKRAWSAIAESARLASVAVVLGTERFVAKRLTATVLVIDDQGTLVGFQDKIQIDPTEEGIYAPGSERRTFQAGPCTFGVAICHEAFRYPETVRWAARRGARIVFHPQFHEADEESYRPSTYADPANPFHEKTALCRAAENTIWFATVNCAGEGSPTTSAVARPDGTLFAWQPYGQEGLLVVDIDLDEATGLLASRLRTEE